MFADEIKRRWRDINRDRAARARLADRLIPGLPVDADPSETRNRIVRVGEPFDALVREMLDVKNDWFDRVRADWPTLFPDIPAKPLRYSEEGRRAKIELQVPSSGHVFALRPKLPKIRRTLLARAGAPKALTLLVKIA